MTTMQLSDYERKQFRIIYADPAWLFKDKAAAGKRGAEFKYPCMPVDEICALPVERIAADSCLLAMWWVSTQPLEALKVCEAWGFKLFKMDGFTWRKVSDAGVESFGMGNLTRSNVEHCLFGLRGKIKDIRQSRSVRQVINASRGRHSEKPDEARRRLVQLCGDVPRIELFARERKDGWQAWGNEA